MGAAAGAYAGRGIIALYAVGCLLACGIIAPGSVRADVHEAKEKAHR